jgi:hypothetical protein
MREDMREEKGRNGETHQHNSQHNQAFQTSQQRLEPYTRPGLLLACLLDSLEYRHRKIYLSCILLFRAARRD